MNDMPVWIIIVLTLILSFFFSGMEMAFISANRLKIELDRKNRKLPGRIISYFQKNISDFVSTILLGNNISLVIYSLSMAVLLEPAIVKIFPGVHISDFMIMLIQTLLSTLIILFLAEFLPKSLFRISPNRTLNALALPLFFFYIVLYPLQVIFVKFSEFILKVIFNFKFKDPKQKFTILDLDVFLKDIAISEIDESRHSQEIQMIQNAIDFRNLKVRDCMIPRNEIAALEINDSIEDLRETFMQTGHSKILIYRDSIDNVVGYVHSYDMFQRPDTIKSIKKNILIVPETLPSREMLKLFIQSRKHVSLVVDEFGGTSGMLTLEDLLEEIVGEIIDEFDKENYLEKKISDREYVFSARLEIDYLNDKYHLNLPEDESYSTLAGFIIHHHESIPVIHERIIIEPFEFIILQSSESRIEKVKMVLIS